MNTLKVEWVEWDNLHAASSPMLGREEIPVVRLEALRAWLRDHRRPTSCSPYVDEGNGVIDDLLAELKDLA